MAERVNLETPIAQLPGVGPARLAQLHRLGIKTVTNLLEHIPFRLEDRSRIYPISQLPFGVPVVLKGTITHVSSRRSQRGTQLIQATVRDDSGSINALWFNQRYLLKYLKPDSQVLLYGERRYSKPLKHPFFVKQMITEPGIVPIYRTTAGLSQTALAGLIRRLAGIVEAQQEILPDFVREQLKLPRRAQALSDCHLQPSEESLTVVRDLFGAEELLLLALEVLTGQRGRQAIQAQPIPVDGAYLKAITDTLPFRLTAEQRRSAWEILQDLGRGQPMSRLLYGEVGSGKTAVALIVAAAVARQGQQVAWINPTVTLAFQQAEVLRRWLEPHGLKVALLTGVKKDDLTEADIVIGTQAVLQDGVALPRLGLVIVDEQHRFGVRERQRLLQDRPAVHLLMMTATPIPRSLAQTVFGHLDLTYLLGRPAHQKPVATVVFSQPERPKIETAITEHLERGEPGYIICPLIDPPEEAVDLFTLERKAVLGEAKRLKQVFPLARLAILHGRLKAAEKEKILVDFRAGTIDILLSTTVVEVGIDNPKATWILVEEAERFGLSQLHQLRGRVGRGEKESICYLASTGSSELAAKRLQAIQTTTDGLKLAEADLALRGPGEVAGFEQSGLPPLRYANWQNLAELKRMFDLAARVLDQGLENYPLLQQKLKKDDEVARA